MRMREGQKVRRNKNLASGKGGGAPKHFSFSIILSKFAIHS